MTARQSSSAAIAIVVALMASLAAQAPGTATQRASSAAPPAVAPGTRVAIVDLASIERLVGQESLESFTERQTAPINAKWEQVRALELRLARERETISDEDRDTVQQQIKRLRSEIDQDQRSAFNAVQQYRSRRQVTQGQAIASTAAALGFQVVLNKTEAVVVWADAAVDITPQVAAAIKGEKR